MSIREVCSNCKAEKCNCSLLSGLSAVCVMVVVFAMFIYLGWLILT